MSDIQLTKEIIIAAERGDANALAKVLAYFQNYIERQCSRCSNPKAAAEKRKYIYNRIFAELKTEWPRIRAALQRFYYENEV